MPPNAAPILLILVAVAAAGLLLFPYILVLLIIVGYLCIIPFTIRSQRWVAARPETWDVKPRQRRAVRRAAGRTPNRRSMARLGLRRPGAESDADRSTPSEPPLGHLRLTARLNTSALDSRRGVVRLHPEALAALGIREWDAVSLTGSRTTAAVVGVAPAGTRRAPHCWTTSRCPTPGLREDTT